MEYVSWHKLPLSTYIKRGCFPVAFDEVRREHDAKMKIFIVTDAKLYALGFTKPLTDLAVEHGIVYDTFFNFDAPTLDAAQTCAKWMNAFKPHVIFAIGGSTAINVAKVAWLLHEHPDADLARLAGARHVCMMCATDNPFTDFPAMPKRKFITVPTMPGSGAEVSPYACVLDEASGKRLILADYELTPYMAIADADYIMDLPAAQVAATGFEAAVHAVDAFVNMRANEFTDGHCVKALAVLLEYLPRIDAAGGAGFVAREKVHNGAVEAGMAYSNACLGLAHSLVDNLADTQGLSHGKLAPACLLNTMLYNVAAGPRKGLALERYAALADALRLLPADKSAAVSPKEKFDALYSALAALRDTLKLPKTLAEAGVRQDALDAALPSVAGAVVAESDSTKCDGGKCLETGEPCIGAFVRPPTEDSIKKLVQACMTDKPFSE